MGSIKVAINGFGTIGKRVADAIDAQEDMEAPDLMDEQEDMAESVLVKSRNESIFECNEYLLVTAIIAL